MIDKKVISNLIYLLDDSDEEVVEQIESKILSFGFEAIPFLEEASLTEQEVLRLQRMQNHNSGTKKNRNTARFNLLEATRIRRFAERHVDFRAY